MSDNHHSHDDHNTEPKPVAFTVPLILASVLIFIIVMFLSLCNPKHGHHADCECKENCSKECMEACEKGDHSLHPKEGVKEEEHAVSHDAVEKMDSTATVVKDSVK
ncbi:MAG: hypothetical protein SFY56_14620 [Bacteroidota bacterium]|nr:hypothetical protein [Bacteroidota bacterium]